MTLCTRAHRAFSSGTLLQKLAFFFIFFQKATTVCLEADFAIFLFLGSFCWALSCAVVLPALLHDGSASQVAVLHAFLHSLSPLSHCFLHGMKQAFLNFITSVHSSLHCAKQPNFFNLFFLFGLCADTIARVATNKRIKI